MALVEIRGAHKTYRRWRKPPEMRELTRQLGSTGVTALLSSHQLAEVHQVCDRVAYGQVIAAGSVGELLERNGFTVTSSQDATGEALRAS